VDAFADIHPRDEKLRVLGSRLESLRDMVEEADRAFRPELLDRLTPEQVALEPIQELAELILAQGDA
jgi:hypothetical protein